MAGRRPKRGSRSAGRAGLQAPHARLAHAGRAATTRPSAGSPPGHLPSAGHEPPGSRRSIVEADIRTSWPLPLLVWSAFGTVIIAALVVAVGVLFPSVVGRARAAAETRPARACVVGLVDGGFLLLLGPALRVVARWSDWRVLPVVLPVLLLLGLGLALGWAAVAGLVGERVWPQRSIHVQRALSAALLTLGSLVPVAGWLVLLPYVSALGLGGTVMALMSRPKPPDSA